MCSIEEQIAIFPSHFVPENYDAIDFNSFDVIAVGCGSSINFSYVEDFKLKPAYSITIGTNTVTSLRFHPSNEYLFIGDSKGCLYIYDYQRRASISQPFQFDENSSIVQISFLDLGLLVLNKKCTFGYLDYSSNDSTLYKFNYIWKTVLPEKTTNFSIDPFRKSRIFIYGRKTNFFMLFNLDKSRKSIKSHTEQLFLMNNTVFQDAQFSIHIRNYIIFMTELNFMLYNVEHNIVIAISHFQKSSSFLHHFIQFPSDDSKLLCFNTSGAITIFKVQEPFSLVSIAEIPFTQQEQQPFMSCVSSLRDDFVACVYSPLGLSLLDISTFKMISVLPFWCDKTTTFTTNGTNYAIGTAKGYIVYGNLYKPEEKAVFQISKKPVTFLSIIPTKHLIYWATDGVIGEIDTGFRRVTTYPKHCLSTQKTVGTMTGGFMVQRESCVLGLFIDGSEVCIPTNHPIIDFSFNDENSTSSSGSIMLILEIGVILFFDYSKVHGISKTYIKRNASFNVNFESCSTWHGTSFAVGMKDGTVVLMKEESLEFEVLDIHYTSIKKIQFCETELFALTDDGYLYSIKDSKVTECSNLIRNFYVINTNLLVVIKSDYSVCFMKRAGFECLASSSKAFPLPDKTTVITNFLFNNPVLINTNHIIFSEEEDDGENDFKGNVDFDKIKSLNNIMSISMNSRLQQKNKARISRKNSANNSSRGDSGGGNHKIKRSNTTTTHVSLQQVGSSKLVENISEDDIDICSSNESPQLSESSQISEGSQISEFSQTSDLQINIESDGNSLSFQSNVSGSHDFVQNTNFGAYIPEILNKNESFLPKDRIVPFFSKVGRDCWLHLLNRSSLRLMNICALGDSSRYEKTLADIISLLNYTPKLQPTLFETYLFAHRVEDADKIISKESPTEPTFMTDSIIATALITFDEEGMTDEQMARIRSAGIELIMNNKFKVGGQLLRIAKLDTVAASYLIQADHPLEAMRFIRSLESEEEKKKYCFEVAIKYLEKSRYLEACLLFMTSDEYHPALFCLAKLRQTYDAYVIKAYLSKKRMLKELKGQKALSVPNLMPLKKLCQTIDVQFASLVGRNGINEQNFKLCVKPRALSSF